MKSILRSFTIDYISPALAPETHIVEAQSAADAATIADEQVLNRTHQDMRILDGVYLIFRNELFDAKLHRKKALQQRLHDIKAELGEDESAGSGASTGRNSNSRPAHHDDDENSLREVLGLGKSFSPSELKKAYRTAMRRNHPDKVADLAKEFQTLAHERTKLINRAFEYFSEKGSIGSRR